MSIEKEWPDDYDPEFEIDDFIDDRLSYDMSLDGPNPIYHSLLRRKDYADCSAIIIREGNQVFVPDVNVRRSEILSIQDLERGIDHYPEIQTIVHSDHGGESEFDSLFIPTVIDQDTIQKFAERTFGNAFSEQEKENVADFLSHFSLNVELTAGVLIVGAEEARDEDDEAGVIMQLTGAGELFVRDSGVNFPLSENGKWEGNVPRQFRMREVNEKYIFEISCSMENLAVSSPQSSQFFLRSDNGSMRFLPAFSYGVELSSRIPEELQESIEDGVEMSGTSNLAIRQHINPFLRLL